jgi:hypothetical protein
VQLLFVSPDPHPDLVRPAAVAFTPEDAIAQMKQRKLFAMRATRVGPITEFQAALMTLAEVQALIDDGTPPGPPGLVPDPLVILVIARGRFVGANGPPDKYSGAPLMTAFAVIDTSTGLTIEAGMASRDIIMPGWAVSS